MTQGVPSGTSSAPPHVLVIDDDELIRMLAGAVLGMAGMDVTEATDGKHGLALLERPEKFSLVLLDLEMPTVGGMDVLKSIRATPATSRLPVVILSGADSEEDKLRVMNAGADDYVLKPIVPERLLARVKSVLQRAGA